MPDSDPRDEAFEIAAAHFFAGDGDQLQLFEAAADFFSGQVCLDEAEALPNPPRNPRYTAATLKANRPEAYNLIVWMRLQRIPLRYAAKVAGVSTNTVAAIDAEIEKNTKVETVRKALAFDMRGLARLTVERIREILLERAEGDLDEGKLGNMLKHLVQQSELLEGNATERVEWNPEKRPPTPYEEFIQQADVVDAEEMDPGGENVGPCEGVDPSVQNRQASQSDRSQGGVSDVQSLDSDEVDQ